MNKGRPKINAKERIGTIRYNNYGSKMIVDEYKNPHDMLIRFIETNEKVKTYWENFIRGNIRSKFDKTVYEIGYLGDGEYKSSKNGKRTNQYIIWYALMQRCYGKNQLEKYPTYKNASVCEEWHNFQNFAKWYDENYYEIGNEVMCLDKDILIKGNKVYSPDTCVFVPANINLLFVKRDAKRGSLPIGVSYSKTNHKYKSECSNGMGKSEYVNFFDTVHEAFHMYKVNKEKVIKIVAENYKDRIPEKLYIAMISYQVEITD